MFFFSKSSFLKNSFRNTISVLNSLDLDQARLNVGPDLGPNCFQWLSADKAGRRRVKSLNLGRVHYQSRDKCCFRDKIREWFFIPKFWNMGRVHYLKKGVFEKYFNVGIWNEEIQKANSVLRMAKMILTLCIQMDSSFWFDTINCG